MKKKAKTAAKKKAKPAKRYEDLTFTDDFMFCKILQNNPQLCKELTELILGKKIGGIVQTERQKSIEITADGKGVRFDVYFKDDHKTVYNIEMQADRFKALPKRSRYYQGMIDLNELERGSAYKDLKPSYVIFICLKNPFPEANLHKYTFYNTCEEMPDIQLNDGAVKVFLSAEGTKDDVSEEMKGFLTFLASR